MSSCLICIGSAAERSLPVLFSALSCGAAQPVAPLRVFCLLPGSPACPEAGSLAETFSACRRLLSAGDTGSLFPSEFSVETCTPSFRTVRELSEDPDDALFIASLRGKGLPFSLQTDPEAVEWCFADLLARPEDPSIRPFLAWLSSVRGEGLRLFVLADFSDAFSAGIAVALLPFLRQQLSSVSPFISLLALAETASPLPAAFHSVLSSSLKKIEDRSLLRVSEEETPAGADAMWLLSLPSSMAVRRAEGVDPHQLAALAAARILGSVHHSETLPPVGFHTRETDGTLFLSSLGTEATSFAAFLQSSSWLLSDLLPALRAYLERPSRFRSLAPNTRNALFRQLFPASARCDLSSLALLESGLKGLLSRILGFLRSVPVSLRPSPENETLWQQAVQACGRYVTVAAEYDTSTAEARESGLSSVRPVHRVSLADTEEELLVRRLREMEHQLDGEAAAREKTLSALGGYRSLQVRLDCLNRCRSALADAQKNAASPAEGLSNLETLRLHRRVRLLEAAVSRCESELEPSSLQHIVSQPAKSGSLLSGSDSPAYCILNPDACAGLEKWLASSSGETALRIPPLLPESTDPDPKQRVKDLFALCRDALPADPLAFLLSKVFEYCRQEVSSLRFLSAGDLPRLPLLPDLMPDPPLLRLRDVLSRLPALPDAVQDSELRGLLAMLLLRQYRRRLSSEASLSAVTLRAGASPVLRYWLSSCHAESVHILSLESGDVSLPFALVLPGRAFLPARRTSAHPSLIPSFAVWFNPEDGAFADPCPSLGEGDRKLLLERLQSCLDALDPAAPGTLYSFLSSFRRDLSRERDPFPEDPHLKTRMQAVFGLSSLAAYESSLTKVSCFYEHFLSSDDLLSCLSGSASFPASLCQDIPEEVLWLYRDVPFAREDSLYLLDSPRASGEDYTLNRLKEECAVLLESSDDFRDALLRNLQEHLEQTPSLLPEIRESAQALLAEAEKPVEKREPVFTWPWDPKSPSLLTVLRESLGEEVSASALSPFSDCLAVFPARGFDVIGDALLSSMCVVSSAQENLPEGAETVPDAVLPPLSPSFARALCLLPEGRTLLKPGFLHFEFLRTPDGSPSFRVTLSLDGSFPVHFIRVYAPEEILYLYSQDIPTLALWPSVPFRPDCWKAYYVYAHLTKSYSVSALSASGAWQPLSPTSENRMVSVLSAFPVCFSLCFEEKTAGLLPNILPEPLIEPSEPVCICVDFGSSGTSVIFSTGHKRRPMQGPVMVRTLLNNPASSPDLLRREFLPAVPVSSLLPTVSRIFRNVPGAAPVPFADGMILMSSGLEDLLSTPSGAIYTSLKWEAEKGRSGFLCLHQVMLMAALQARYEGASDISLRFSLPDEMAREGRESLMNLFLSLSADVLQESGYASSSGSLPVSFASESSALGAYFRFCASDDTRGGFMVLDLGACTADISLFMRGREQAVRTCQIPLGIHYMLLPALLRDPELLARDFAFITDETLSRDLRLLARALSDARSDPSALRRARAALDYFVADHFSLLVSAALQVSSSGFHTRSGALLLLYLSYLLMLSGLVLLQLAVDPSRNDFLPEQMSLCLSGRGAALLESFPPALKTSLWHFLSMFRNKRVASLAMLFSAEKKMEIPVGLSLLQDVYPGLPPAAVVPASIAVRPAELLPEFLLRFRREFPYSADLLFPGFFTDDYYHPFTDRGDALVSASVDQTFPSSYPDPAGGSSPRPYDALAAWPGNLLDLISS